MAWYVIDPFYVLFLLAWLVVGVLAHAYYTIKERPLTLDARVTRHEERDAR